MISHLKTTTVLILTDHSNKPVQIPKTHPNYDEIEKLVITGKPTEETFEAINRLLYPKKGIEKILGDYGAVFKQREGFSMLKMSGNSLYCEIDNSEFKLPSQLVKFLIQNITCEEELGKYVKFMRSLSLNPRREVIDQLWGFIESCGLSITENGGFLAYKRVNSDYTSIFDDKTDNSIGTRPSMRRSDVEYNPDKTCSAGLHFAAWGYLDHYASAENRKTLLLEIMPEDVVSIPSDYNNQKGRACEYLILSEVKDKQEWSNLL